MWPYQFVHCSRTGPMTGRKSHPCIAPAVANARGRTELGLELDRSMADVATKVREVAFGGSVTCRFYIQIANTQDGRNDGIHWFAYAIEMRRKGTGDRAQQPADGDQQSGATRDSAAGIAAAAAAAAAGTLLMAGASSSSLSGASSSSSSGASSSSSSGASSTSIASSRGPSSSVGAPQVGGGGGDGPEKEQKLVLGKIRQLPEELQLRIGVLALGIATREREENLRVDEAVMLHAALADLEEEARDESEI